ncbi:unnamed protein product, partial [Timema podura]|nr:unnamed protein product [Timema podura]
MVIGDRSLQKMVINESVLVQGPVMAGTFGTVIGDRSLQKMVINDSVLVQGPVMAGTFGTVIGDRSLQKMGVLNELFGLGISLVVGFLYGIFMGLTGQGDWPTMEMTSRGEFQGLWVGAVVAIASGAAVSIAILGDNTSSLVGVAISVSLLPTAVNA